MGWFLTSIAVGAIGLSGAACAQTRAVTGQAGLLAEWDLTATVTEQTGGEWSGPLNMKHVGFCGVDGPEEKTGELLLRLPDVPGAEITATLTIDGVVCTFSGSLGDDRNGLMVCPDRRAMPVMLSIQ